MILIDTSIWINIFRDKTQRYSRHFYEFIGEQDIVFTRFQQLELLQGCRDEREWSLLSEYLDGQDYIEIQPTTWSAAARIYYDLRKQGLTVRSPIDCCIAQITLENQLLLIHDDRDFITISQVVPLKQKQWVLS
ncbi:MAG: PIN domain nuclease [Methylococcaceae bacterium]|nr:PIN domain nuclease [Methylococcaceae bacterium]